MIAHQHPNLLFVSHQAQGDVNPSGVFVHVVLTSDKFFSGSAALQKAEELRRLCSTLNEFGVSDGDIALSGVSLDVSTGLFTRSSSVTYRVRVHLREVALLPALLDAVAGAKSATLSHLAWDYDSSHVEEMALLQRCAASAHEKARTLAEAVGARLGPIHAIREGRTAHVCSSSDEVPMAGPATMKRRSTSIQSELAGFDLAPKRRIGVQVSLEYEILPATT